MKTRRPPINLWQYPKRTCPVCGKKWLLQCEEEEWGYAYRDMGHGHQAKRIALTCSYKCMKEYARLCDRENAKHVEKLRCFKIWWMYDQEWMSVKEISEKTGIKMQNVQSMIYQVETIYWREAEYITTQRSLTAI